MDVGGSEGWMDVGGGSEELTRQGKGQGKGGEGRRAGSGFRYV